MARRQLAAYAVEFWQGLFTPVGTPTGVIARLNQALLAAATDQALVQDMAARGIIDIGSLPPQLGELLALEATEWAELVRASGITED